MKKFNKKVIDNICMFLFFLYMISYNIFSYRSNTVIISEIILICFLVLITVYILLNKKLYIGVFGMFLLLYLIWSLTTNYWSINQLISIKKFSTIIQLSIVSFLIYNYFDSKHKISRAILFLNWSYIILALYTVYIYGINNILSGNVTGRIGAEISQENVLGMSLALGSILSFYNGLYLNKKIYYVPSIFLFILSSFTGSRKALIMIILGIMFLIIIKNGTKKIIKTILVLMIVGIIFLLILKIPAFDMVLQRFEGILSGENVDASSIERINMIKDGWKLFLEKPFIGYGLDCFRDLGYGTYSHNNYIEILINGGIISFVLFYSMYLYCSLNLLKLTYKKDKLATILFILIIIQIFTEFAQVSYYSKLVYINFSMYFSYIKVNKKSVF